MRILERVMGFSLLGDDVCVCAFQSRSYPVSVRFVSFGVIEKNHLGFGLFG